MSDDKPKEWRIVAKRHAGLIVDDGPMLLLNEPMDVVERSAYITVKLLLEQAEAEIARLKELSNDRLDDWKRIQDSERKLYEAEREIELLRYQVTCCEKNHADLTKKNTEFQAYIEKHETLEPVALRDRIVLDLTKQNEEQAKEIISRLADNHQYSKQIDKQNEIIAVLEDGLKKIYPGLPSYRSLEVYCERRHADELLAKLAEH